ncbi:MAG: ABC transporter permease [Bacteroides sp.]|nr:ABC transporter permease [Bacteroides sp.]
MICHSIKIAFRNLKKYRIQTLLSVIGLAVGFVCFVLSVIWVRYEMSYNTFHRDADRMFLLRHIDNSEKITSWMPAPLLRELKEAFPEIEEICMATPSRKEGLNILTVDSAFLSMFSVTLLAGSLDFLNPSGNQVAITRKLADQLFPEGDPLGQSLDEVYRRGSVVGAILSDWSTHTNFPADIVRVESAPAGWAYQSSNIVIK